MSRKCSSCGAEVPDGAPGGHCVRCAMRYALDAVDLGEFDEASAPAAAAEKPGARVGHYRLCERIGEGGCGVVYVAEQEEPVRRRVALKIIKLGMDTEQVIARFSTERQALALMDHPNIARALDAGATDAGRPYFVMELVRGATITRYCDQHHLSARRRLELFIKVCQAVQHAHQKGIIHRDLKPSNILVQDDDGEPAAPKVIDFGIAKATGGRLSDLTLHTDLRQFLGTPVYMSPEQAANNPDIDTRSDIYSLGILLYELLAGKPPFDPKELLAAGLNEMRRTIQEKDPVRPSARLSAMAQGELATAAEHRQTEPPKLISLLRGDLDWIVMKCLEKDPKRRYATANDLARDLEHHLGNEPVLARPQSRLYQFQKLVRRNRLVFAAGAGIAAVFALGVLGTAWQAVRATQAERDQRMTLAGSDFAEAERLIAQGEPGDALAYLARSAASNPGDDAAETRLTTLLAYHSWMVPSLVLRHDAEVMFAEFSPDGTAMATASRNGKGHIWDAQSGRPLTPPLPDGGVSARFSPDGTLVVTAGAAARVWNVRTGQPLTPPMHHNVRSAAFSPEGSRVLSVSEDGSLCVWDIRTGQPATGPWRHGGGQVFSAAFSADGKRIVSAGGDGMARVWEAQSGEALLEPLRHLDWVHDAQFSPDGKWIATASYDKSARVWNAQTGQPVTESLKHDEAVLYVRFSPDGSHIVTACMDCTARVWDASSGQPVTERLPHSGQVVGVEFSRDGTRVLTASWDNTARVWDAQTGRPLTEPLKHGGRVGAARFSPDGKRILTASGDGSACLWLALSAPALPEILPHGSNVVSAHFSPDGRQILTASQDSMARLWDARTGRALAGPLKHAGPVLSAQFSHDGKQVVTGSEDFSARLWDARNGISLFEPMKHGGPVLSAQFSPDNRWVVTASQDGTARVWNARTGRPRTEPLKHRDTVVSAEFSPDGRSVATGSWDDTVCVWDAESGQVRRSLAQNGRGSRSAQFRPDGSQVLNVCRWGETADFWDVSSAQRLEPPLRHNDTVASAQFDPQGRRVVTASMDYTAVVWDARTRSALTERMKHGGGVTAATFSRDGRQVATASKDCTARVWDAWSGRPLTDLFRHGGVVRGAEFSPDRKRVLTASDDAKARVWDIAPSPAQCPDWLLRLAETVSGQVLNKRSVLEPTKLNRAEVLTALRERLKQEPDDDDWVAWGRWFLADPAERPISPFSNMTLREYLRRRLEAPTPESLAEAEQLAAGDAALLRRVGEARKALKSAQPSQPGG